MGEALGLSAGTTVPEPGDSSFCPSQGGGVLPADGGSQLSRGRRQPLERGGPADRFEPDPEQFSGLVASLARRPSSAGGCPC